MKRQSFYTFKEKWLEVEKYLIVAILYHSESLSDVQKYLDTRSNSDPHDETVLQLNEEFSLIAKQVNVVLTWMLGRLQGESEFQIIINELLDQATTVITQRNKEIMENKMMAKAEAETRQYADDLATCKEKQKLEEESKKQEATPVSA